MTQHTPEALFLENGGKALLEAYGIRGASPISDYFSTNLPAAAKPGEQVVPGKVSRPAPMGALALLVAWPGGMRIYCNAASPGPLPGVTIARCIHGSQFALVAHEVMDLPRPLLFLSVGNSYGPDVADARLTLDKDVVEAFGNERFVLSRRDVRAILDAADESGVPVAKLRRSAMDLERAVAGEAALGSPKLRKATFGILGIKDKDEGAEGKLAAYWKLVDALPLSSDPAWRVAKHLSETAIEQGSEAAA